MSQTAGGADSEIAGYPTRPVRVLVGFAAGGATDIIARVVGEKLAERWKRTVVIDNRPGASGIIAGEVLTKAAKDGYTLGMQSVTQTILPAMTPKMPYDIVRDFTPLSLAANVPFIVVVGASTQAASVRNVGDLVALARTQPKRVSYASGGTGTLPHLAGEIFRTMVGIEVVHVPYKGGAPAVADVVSGQVDCMFANAPEVVGFVRGGRLRAIGVTSTRRLANLPNVPAVAESTPGYEAVQWYGFWGPAGLPRPLTEKLSGEIAAVVALADVRSRFEDMGMEAVSTTTDALDKQVRAELVRWTNVVKSLGLDKGS